MGRGSPRCNERASGPAAGTLLEQPVVRTFRHLRILSPVFYPPDKELSSGT